MPIQQTGVQFVNQGLSGALSGLTQYNTALLKTTQTVITATRNINNAYSNISTATTKNFSLIGNLAMDFSKNMGTAHTGVLRFTGGLKNLILTVSGLMLLRSAIRGIMDAFRSLTDTMVEGASNTELLSIRFQNLTAISIQNTQGITDYSTALQMAQGPAQALLDWVNQMAVKTMFGRDEIAQVLALGMAFDMTAGQSQTLTMAMVDWASGMGLGQDALQRMVVNFGQMMRMGKITQRELRDLAIGGLFPVKEALRRIGEEAGLSGVALQKFMSDTATSGVPVNALLNEFVEIAGEKFPNAGEKMAKTWKGVTQNIKDFVTTILGAALLGPTMNKMVESLSDLLDRAMSPSVRAAATVIGERLATSLTKVARAARIFMTVLGDLVKVLGIPIPTLFQLVAGFEILADVISTGLRGAASALRDWIDTTGVEFTQRANEFFNWGFNLVSQFAAGIIEGVATVLVAAMNLLSSALSWFLGPGSPPRVAPEIDKWGILAMEQYLHGMTLANFDILKDLQGPLQAALNALAAMGSIAKDQVGAIFASVSQQIIKAMAQLEATGKVGEAVFRAIRKAGGVFGKELESLARKQFALLAAMKEVEKAQKALTDAQKADKEAKSRVDDLITEYRALVEAGASKDILEAKRAEIKAAMDEHDQTKENVALAEERVESAEDMLKPLQNAVKLQEELVSQMIALANAQAKVTEGAGAGAGIGGAFDALGDALSEFDSDMKMTSIKFEMKMRGIRLLLDEMKTDFETKLGTAFQPLLDAIDKDVLPKIEEVKGKFEELTGLTIPDINIGEFLGGLDVGALASAAGSIAGIALSLGGIWKFARILISPLGKVGLIIAALGLVTGVVKRAWDKDLGGMKTTVKKWFEAVKPKIEEVWRKLQGKDIPGVASPPIAPVVPPPDLGLLSSAGDEGGTLFGDSLTTSILKAFPSLMELMYNELTKGVANIDWSKLGGIIGTAIGTAISEAIKFVLNIPQLLLNVITDTDWTEIANTLWNAFVASMKLRWELFKAGWEFVLGLLVGFFTAYDYLGIIEAFWNNFVARMKLSWELFKLGWVAVFDFMKNAIETGEDVIKALAAIADGILKAIGKALASGAGWLLQQILKGLGVNAGGAALPPGMTQDEAEDLSDIYHAGGGLAARSGWYHLAEQGAEMIIPARQTKSFMDIMRSMSAPRSAQPVSAHPVFNNSTSNSSSRVFQLSMSTTKSTGNVAHDFAVMEVLAG